MNDGAIVVGAGVGGLSAAIALAQRGLPVTIIEARNAPGGLASGLVLDGLKFDAGPYILLDRPGLEWAFEALGIDLASTLELTRIEDVYEVEIGDHGTRVRLFADLDETAAGMDRDFPGAGKRYVAYVKEMTRLHEKLLPMQYLEHPSPLGLVAEGAISAAPFLLSSLGGALAKSQLPEPICRALSIWTHVAAQDPDEAPAPMALVPALFHGVGAYFPRGGIASVVDALVARAAALGVRTRLGERVTRITSERHAVSGVKLESGEELRARVVISDTGAPATYVDLTTEPSDDREDARALPLQSPGLGAYLAVRGTPVAPYLRFKLPERAPTVAADARDGELCRCFVVPGLLDPTLGANGELPARLVVPLPFGRAEAMSEEQQGALLTALLAEPWWRAHGVTDARVLERRTTHDWGREHRLHRNAMNPVMTAALMRRGRIAHKSPTFENLYLAGSSTHPGQWVSFVAISGVHVAGVVAADLDLD